MKHAKLTAAQSAANGGYTDVFHIPYTDLTANAAADNTAVAITLDALALGDVVKQDVLVEVRKAWTGPSDLTATVSIGVTSAVTALTPALTITTAGAGTAVKTTDSSDCQTNPHYCAAAAIDMLATFTPDADSGVDEFTAGEVVVWMTIVRAANRASVQI